MTSPDHGGPLGREHAVTPTSSPLARRDLLRWFGAAGVAAVVGPGLLTACDPAPSTPMPLAPDPSVRALGFVGGLDLEVAPGAWCWFQAPRASFGPDGLLWMGASVAQTGTPADGSVRLYGFDTRSRALVVDRQLAMSRQDDHTSPSVLAVGDEVQVSWALHQAVDYLDIGRTSRAGPLVTQRISRPGAIKAPARGTSYASVHVVAGQRWLLYRGEQFSWNLLTSPDGQTWTARGLVVAPGSAGDRPYVQAASDGKRLHLVVTNGNPTEYRGTCAYAGTIEADLRITGASGRVVGAVGPTAPAPAKLHRLAVGVVGATEADDVDMWLSDLQVVDGRPTGILVRRYPRSPGSVPNGDYAHRYYWIRQRPTGWVVEHLAYGGSEICATQPDYAALGAQDPSLATRVVIATDVHPVTQVPLVSAADGIAHVELFEGTRVAEGTWTWEALTQDSLEDNYRPVIAAGGTAKSLAWMRGRYWSWTNAATRIVVRNAVDPSAATSGSAGAPVGAEPPPAWVVTPPTAGRPSPANDPG